MRSRTRPVSPASPATNSCARHGSASSAPAPHAASLCGTSRQPRTVRPSSAARPAIWARARSRSAAIDGKEGQAGGVPARLGQGEPGDRAEERVGNLREDAGTVAGVRVRAGGAAVLQVAQDAEGIGHHAVATSGPQVCDKADATGVMFETAVV